MFPCRAQKEGDRSAKSPRTANGFHDASTDPAVIRLMPWGGDTLIGVPTGGRHQGAEGPSERKRTVRNGNTADISSNLAETG
ncbi:hypothetical protein [Novosphingopyxis sp.]|uniref:hypothetical protein n=1 Tax=Novosphingopyxis sp. TaxID=2709690 RepID=UPI003B5CE41D